MAQSRGYQRGGSGGAGPGRPARPWNVYWPREYVVRGERGDETRSDFIRVGAAFRLKEREGFTVEIQLPLNLPPGTRLVAMPRPDDDPERDGR